MNKTIKIIDLLSKIANGEEVPEKIKIGFKNFHYCKDCKCYEDECERDLVIKYNELNNEVEIIEDEDINIKDIDNRLKKIEKMIDRFEYIEKRIEAIDSQKGIFRYC